LGNRSGEAALFESAAPTQEERIAALEAALLEMVMGG
jgi:DNA repair photolyase